MLFDVICLMPCFLVQNGDVFQKHLQMWNSENSQNYAAVWPFPKLSCPHILV